MKFSIVSLRLCQEKSAYIEEHLILFRFVLHEQEEHFADASR